MEGNIEQPVNTVTGGMIKDMLDVYLKTTHWTYARNATTCLPDGMQGGLSTECANILCTTFPYTLIGAIPLVEDQWCVFLTDDITSEIGIFTESLCSYTTLTGPQTCPAFNRKHLIIGAARRGYDCGFDVYWTDSVNPNRVLNTAKVPFIQNCTAVGSCITCVDTTVLDCEKLRLAPHFSIPCLKLAKSTGAGTLRNGSYRVAIRYTINDRPCTDFVAVSPIMSVFSHNNSASGLTLTLSGTESTVFTEMEVVLISEVNAQVEARRIGVYSTSQSSISIDDIDLTQDIIPLEIIPLNTPALEKSDALYAAGGYLTMVGPYTKPTPNYQPLANNIRAWWVCTEYDDRYYQRGGDTQGMNIGMMRDEVYAAYIRWVYMSGDKTDSYHIPGLPAGTAPTIFLGSGGLSTGDTGTVVAYGRMAGYSSTEIYDNRKPSVWGPLCGRPIMHHKFPDQTLHPAISHFTSSYKIRIMGWHFDNIALPVDNNGNIIPDIQGYEILRASRDGHMSVIAKGQVNHMRGYKKLDGTTGLYQNYPYDDLHADRYLTTSQTIGTVGGTLDLWQNNEQTIISQDVVSFHSPDTSFQHPNLGGSGSLILYQAHAGVAEGTFDVPYLHPKIKLLTDLSNVFGLQLGGLVAALQTINALTGSSTSLSANEDVPMTNPLGFGPIPEGPLGSLATGIYAAAVATALTINAIMRPITVVTVVQQVLNIVNGLIPPIQYARQYNSHGFYNEPVYTGKVSYNVADYQYVGGYLQTFGQYDINNLYRNNYIALNVGTPLPLFPAPYNIDPVGGGTQNYGAAVQFIGDSGSTGAINPTVDCSRFTLGQAPSSPNPPGPRAILGPFKSPIVSWYGAYKVPQPSQYGQVDSPKQIPISCVIPVDTTSPVLVYKTPVLFGGDTYINRYTEKNPFFFFNDWLYGQPTDYTYDYTQYENIPYPRYWINNSKIYYDFWALTTGSGASRNWHLDELANTASNPWPPLPGINSKFYVESGYFYLFNNGIRDFYVESTVNVGYRDWEDDHSKRFYDPYGYTTLEYMFRSDIIKSDILYKYDYSLSAGKFWDNSISWGKMFPRDYDPDLAYTCFSYYPRRLYYSLLQSEEIKQDNWRIFLPNNYKDMPSQVSAIKEIDKSGALILLTDRSPVQLLGLQTMPSSSGIEYTVGTGALFDQPLAQVSNTDQSLQYGGCQSRLSVINTPHGVFWVSQNTGKVFNYTGDMRDITPGLKWHLSQYLPSKLLQQYPDYPLKDNPVVGIGVQCIYDNVNEILYICKKDYRAWDKDSIRYNSTRGSFQYLYNTGTEVIPVDVELTDSIYFEDCSWSLSYDCRKREWISFHTWIPALNIPSKTHFLTSNTVTDNGRSVWRHNQRTDLFCNYYGQDHYFDVEYYVGTGMTDTTLQSLEIISESYNYKANQTDKFQEYNGFFDRAMIHNPEQNSYMLNLTLKPWDNPYAITAYPFFTAGAYNMLYSKVENVYRLNNFYDFTDDRFQFGIGAVQAIQTAGNGVDFTLNNLYFNINKQWNQRKRFRYRGTKVLLRKNIVGNNSITVIGMKAKNQLSMR